jgi:hypothetical protein
MHRIPDAGGAGWVCPVVRSCVPAASDESETRHKLSVCTLSPAEAELLRAMNPSRVSPKSFRAVNFESYRGCEAQHAANRYDAYVGDRTQLCADAMPVEDNGPNGVV